MMSNSPITDCSGFFTDSGGGNDYGPNENFSTTICADNSPGTHIRLTFSGVIVADAGDELCFFDGETSAAPMLSCNTDFLPNTPFIIQATAANTSGCVTITFNSDGSGQAAGWNADIECVASCQQIQAILVSTDPPVMPADTGYIDVCPMERISFTAEGSYPQDGVVYNHSDFTSDFEWDFGDGAIAYGLTVNHAYAEPGGYVVQLTITDQEGCTNTNFISQRVRVSTRPTFAVGGDIPQQICVDDTVSLNAVANMIADDMNISASPNSGSFSVEGVRSDSLALPDGTGSAYETSISFTDFAPGQVLTSIDDLLSICVNMEHSWLRDLEISLTCPDGTSVVLHNHPGAFGSGVRLGVPVTGDPSTNPSPGTGFEYCWTPQAMNGTWLDWANSNDGPGFETLPSGDYSSFEGLEAFLGCPLNGEWTITVEDLWAQDNGFIFSWSINFNPDIYPSIETFTPTFVNTEWQNNPNIFYNEMDSIAASPQNAGAANFTYIVMDDFGCTYDTTILVDVLPPTHPDCFNCADNLTPVDDLTLCEGQTTSVDVSPMIDPNTDVVFQSFPQYSIGNANHPAANPYNAVLSINSVNPNLVADPLTQIESVCFDMTTDFASDIAVFLRSPNGNLIELVSGHGGSGMAFTNTCFSPAATDPILSSTAPFTGTFQPEGNWSQLVGSTINGDWTLLVSDAFAPAAFGMLNSWSITFKSQNEIDYSWGPATGISCVDCPNPDISPMTSTNYTVTAMDSYGCESSDDVAVQVINDLAGPMVNCGITGDGELTFDWTEVNGIQDYEISINGGAFIAPNNGNFSHIITSLNFNDNVEIEVRPILSGTGADCEAGTGLGNCTYNACGVNVNLVGTPTDESCFGAADGSATFNTTGGQIPYVYTLNGMNPQNDNTITNLSEGDYEVIVSDADGCADTIMLSIAAPDSISLNLVTANVDCHGGNDGEATVMADGGNGNFTYQWSNELTTASVMGLEAGTYQVTVEDMNQCSNTAEILISQPDSISLMLSATPTLCANTTDGTANATASGGTGTLTYQWSNGMSTPNIDQLFAGTYCVTVTDAFMCQKTDCIEVAAPDALVIDEISEVPADCNGNNTGMAIVTASGGAEPYQYLWSDGLGQVADTAVFLAAAFYEVTVTDGNGCQAVSGVNVTQPDVLTVSVTSTEVLCNGGSDGTATAIPTGGTADYTYVWGDTDGQTTETALDLPFGNYTVTVTDAMGCTAEGFGSVQQPGTAVTATIMQVDTSCHGLGLSQATVFAQGGTGTDYTYVWSNASGNTTAINLDTIGYSVIVTDENGCSTTESILIQDYPEIEIIVAFVEPTCFGDSDGLMGANSVMGGGDEFYTYLWNTVPPRTTAVIDNLVAGDNYSVTVTDGQGCAGSVTRELPEPEPVQIEVEGTDVLCNGAASGTTSVTSITGSRGSVNYVWSANANLQTTATAENLSAGMYAVTVTDSLGCSTNASLSIGEPTAISTSFEVSDNLCFGNNEGAITATATGGTPNYNYVWSTADNSEKIGALFAGIYYLTITDENGCTHIDSSLVEQPDALFADLMTQDVTCFDDRDGTVSVSPQGGTPPYQFSLDNDFYNGASTMVGLVADDYDIFVRDANDCLWFDGFTIDEPEEFIVMVEAPQIPNGLEVGDSTTLFAESENGFGDIDFVWSAPYEGVLKSEEGNAVEVKPMNSVFVELYGIDENGCEATTLYEILVVKNRIVEVPTGFTPNGDGINDILMVHGKPGTTIKSFQVFDRWGEKMYETPAPFDVNDSSIGWDGRFRNQDMGTGAYLWFLEVEYLDGVTEVYKGSTTLIR